MYLGVGPQGWSLFDTSVLNDTVNVSYYTEGHFQIRHIKITRAGR